MAEDIFRKKVLAEKLSKLTISDRSITSLSQWCLGYRRNAWEIVEIWEKEFTAHKEKHVPFLYLANDILQNGRREGSEFQIEFWKVLPSALKVVFDSGSDKAAKEGLRLVEIWKDRRVFGSRVENFRDIMLGKIPPPPLVIDNENHLKPINALNRDARFITATLAVGGLPEKLVNSFQLLKNEEVKEAAALGKCRDAVSSAEEITNDVMNALLRGKSLRPDIMDEIQKAENVLQQSIQELEKSGEARVSFIAMLKEALQDEELKLERTQAELHRARDQMARTVEFRLQLYTVPQTQSVDPSTMSTKAAASTCSAQQLLSIFSSYAATERELDHHHEPYIPQLYTPPSPPHRSDSSEQF